MNISEQLAKLYMQALVAPIKATPSVYKYLTYESGLKMLDACNIQFTRAAKLNDCMDCCAEKVDYSDFKLQHLSFIDSQLIKDITLNKDRQVFSNYGVCSLGTSADNNILWERYTQNGPVKNGICIELDTNGILRHLNSDSSPNKICALCVDYQDNITAIISRSFLTSDKRIYRLHFMRYIIATKNKIDPISGFNWEAEKELRFIYLYELNDDFLRIQIPKNCVKRVWCDKDISLKEFQDLKTLVKGKYQLNITQR